MYHSSTSVTIRHVKWSFSKSYNCRYSVLKIKCASFTSQSLSCRRCKSSTSHGNSRSFEITNGTILSCSTHIEMIIINLYWCCSCICSAERATICSTSIISECWIFNYNWDNGSTLIGNSSTNSCISCINICATLYSKCITCCASRIENTTISRKGKWFFNLSIRI